MKKQAKKLNWAGASAFTPNPQVMQYFLNNWTPQQNKRHVFAVLLFAGLTIIAVAMWGLCFMAAIIPDETDSALLDFSCMCLLATMVFFALMIKHAHYYQWRYLFLGKRYRQQEAARIAALGNLSAETSKMLRPLWKEYYRATGSVDLGAADGAAAGSAGGAADGAAGKNEPFCAWNEWIYRNLEFNYADALPWQKEDYLIYALYSSAASGDGLDGFYHYAFGEPFSTAELKQLIASMPISEELRALLQRTFKEGSLLVGADWPDTTGKQLELEKADGMIDWDLPDFANTLICMADETSQLLCPFEDELQALSEKRLVPMFAYEGMLELCQQEDCVQMWVSADRLKHVEIVYDGSSYKHFFREYYLWDDEDQKTMNEPGQWMSCEPRTGFFATAELALNDVKHLMEGFVQVK